MDDDIKDWKRKSADGILEDVIEFSNQVYKNSSDSSILVYFYHPKFLEVLKKHKDFISTEKEK